MARQTTNDLIIQLEAILGIERDSRIHAVRVMAIQNAIKELQRRIILLEYQAKLADDNNLKQGKLPLNESREA